MDGEFGEFARPAIATTASQSLVSSKIDRCFGRQPMQCWLLANRGIQKSHCEEMCNVPIIAEMAP